MIAQNMKYLPEHGVIIIVILFENSLVTLANDSKKYIKCREILAFIGDCK